MRYKCVKFQLAILTNKLFMVKGIGLTPSNCIKNRTNSFKLYQDLG